MSTKKVQEYSDLSGPITVQELLDQWGPAAIVDVDYDSRLTVTWERDETPQEREIRERKAARERERREQKRLEIEARERAMYERLKEKYES